MNTHHEIIRFTSGQATLKSLQHGEAMHSEIGAEREAELVYVGQSRLRERLRQNRRPVIYDLGLGIAANSVASFRVAMELGQGLEVHSFETETGGLQLALEAGSETFPHLIGFEEPLKTLLAQSEWRDPGRKLHWHLWRGDFRWQLHQAPPPDVVFFDMYSPQACPEVWGRATFQALYDRCAQSTSEMGPLLITYSSSTAVRCALLLAGFHIGQGKGTLKKRETTVAALARRNLEIPLGACWLEHWKRSSRPWPQDVAPNEFSSAQSTLARRLMEGDEKHGLGIER